MGFYQLVFVTLIAQQYLGLNRVTEAVSHFTILLLNELHLDLNLDLFKQVQMFIANILMLFVNFVYAFS